jgi:hypothetical protein
MAGVAILDWAIDTRGQRLLKPDAEAHAIAIGAHAVTRQIGGDTAIGITTLA